MLMICTTLRSRYYTVEELENGAYAVELVTNDPAGAVPMHVEKVGTFEREADAVLMAWMHCTEHGYTVWVPDELRCPTE